MSKKVPTRQLGKNGPQVSAIGFGAGGNAKDIYCLVSADLNVVDASAFGDFY